MENAIILTHNDVLTIFALMGTAIFALVLWIIISEKV